MTVSEDLTSWAARNKAQTAQAALALQVAAALENDAERPVPVSQGRC
jgi:hypothetical protein